ncbi:MAG TPA: HlyD family secretion protein [Steroidobacteraceae bacterium]|nr:HlyD family secretion protein [Steroidobacteraceae bacterium]
MRGRPTLIAFLLVTLVIGVALATIRSGTTAASVTGTESTDDAYVRADLIAISSHIAGYVAAIPVRDNEVVRRGQLMATIEDDDYRARVAGAEAAVEAARSAADALSQQAVLQSCRVTAASAEVRAADAVLIQARLEHDRQLRLVDDGTTSRRELEAAAADEDRLSASRVQREADWAAAREMLQVIHTQVLEAEQAVRMKAAALELARIDLGYTRIVSPVAGQLSERAALRGEYVMPGTRIGLVVPLPNVWVVATFREAQMAHMYPGQSAVITVDSAPGRRFRGTVDSFAPASGALQALLPPDNATGNFTKIAQRFAVKVILAARQAGIERLRPGMSAVVTVDVRAVPPRRVAR